jgi:hypothetical protein
MVSDQRRVDERVRVLARALDVPLDLDAISSEVAGRTLLTGPQDLLAVKALLGRVVDEPYYTDDLWAWIVGLSPLPDDQEAELMAMVAATAPLARPDELLERIATTIRLAVNGSSPS